MEVTLKKDRAKGERRRETEDKETSVRVSQHGEELIYSHRNSASLFGNFSTACLLTTLIC